MDNVLGVHPDAWMPELARQAFRWARRTRRRATVVTDGQRTPGKVAVFATCYVNYNEPGIGHDLLKVLEHNEHPLRDRREGEPAAACPSSSSAT
jgi:glycerol-3-phosphate dehydrogenase subunit C